MRHRNFLRTFQLILVGTSAAPGCLTFSCPATDESFDRALDPEQFSNALSDGELSRGECSDLCGVGEYESVRECAISFGDSLEREPEPGESSAAAGAGGDNGDTDLLVHCELIGRSSICEGRRHHSWGERGDPAGQDPVGVWLARASANEAASVHSFRALAYELGVDSIGADLMRALRHAARQEIGHARLLERLAALRGCHRPLQKFSGPSERALLDIAIENAREGCVAEVLAGLIALHQAHTAADLGVRAAFCVIAVEEAAHGDLAWELHQRFLGLLTSDERRQLASELRRAISELVSSTPKLAEELMGPAAGPEREQVRRQLGLPDQAVETYLRQQLAASLMNRLQQRAA